MALKRYPDSHHDIIGKIVFKSKAGISFVELCVFSFNRNAFLEHPQFIQSPSPFILALREAWIIVAYGAGMVTISYLRLSHCEPRYKQIEEETNKKTFSIDDHGKLITDGDYQNIFRQGRMREADITLETDMNYNQDERQNNSLCAILEMADASLK